MADTPGSERSRREAEIVDKHLPDGYSAEPESVTLSTAEASSSEPNLPEQNEESSLKLQGGDIHRDIYKIKARASAPKRSNTFSATSSPRLNPRHYASVPEQREPGGFRRQYLQRQSLSRRATTGSSRLATPNFINFLEMYGSFAGEDLADTDDEDESAVDDSEDAQDGTPTENRPLLGRRRSTKRWKREGNAGTTKTFFTLLKAFVGTGIMFLPKAFNNGGILFSSITLIAVSIITSLCFNLLLKCRKQYGGGYGELSEAIVGPTFRRVVLGSITLSQLGFVCAGLIFTAENLFSFLDAVTHDKRLPIGVNGLIAIQAVVLAPLTLIRNISKLGPAALLADVFILIGLVYIWYYDIWALSANSMASSVKLFNPSSFTLTIGSAIFTFEGIGLILPIQASMKKPERFSYLLYLVMFIITIIFTSIGALCYATFGSETKIQIISNFPQNSKLVNAVQCIYSIAVLVGEPVQLFPAVRIIEQALFGEKATGKKSQSIKWKKNGLRMLLMGLCIVVAILGATDLDKFVALIGSFACVPLVYIYPAFLHYRGIAKTTWQKAFDIGMMLLGVVAMAYTTIVTVAQWVEA
ncbi:hypothetical protein K431DRAFT_289689 [Polychaeton citri CBS 116435]|uniref:Amino acid transporter transmembrane domain-containing protein n=1 Tax=Polychaeton citri CBS 116435 TaxID=1314669 RepID=A0A9P4PW84_9PEZI|nr:hypothetical protein K431DRAFT_289689 [Polychaeton citri CBS 116435]